MRPTPLFVLCPLFASLVACGPRAELAVSAASGERVSAELTARPDGTLHADRLFVTERRSGDGEENDAEENDGQENENDAEENDGEETDDVDCENGLTAAGTECDGGPDANEEGEVDDETYDAGNARTWVQGRPNFVADRGIYQVAGIDVNAGALSVGTGAQRFVGKYNGNHHFSASAVQPGRAGLAIGGVSEGIVDHGDGSFTLTVFGTPVRIDRSTHLSRTADPLSAEADENENEDDGDGKECEQDGEHEGDDAGC